MSEASLIQRIDAATTVRAGTSIGIGDDAAVLDGGAAMVLTHDLLVQDVHFTLPTPARDLGWKALAVNLSDIAAMGASPVAALVGLVLPDESALDVDALYAGMEELAEETGTTIAGGDISAGALVVIAVTAAGTLAADQAALTRAGARPGDRLVVTGPLGASEAGRLLLPTAVADPDLIDAHRRPRPDFDGAALLRRIGARALMDCSDGLLLDASRMAAASGCAVSIALEAVPRAAGIEPVAEVIGVAPDVFAATAGEDYRLLAALPSEVDLPEGLAVVGTFEAGEGLDVVRDGLPVDVSQTGYVHDV